MRNVVRMERPHLHPYICARCRVGDQPNREYFVDTGIDFDWEGVVYLCNTCLKDIALTTGDYFTKAQLDEYLAVQQRDVRVAGEITRRYEGMVKWAFENFGIDIKSLERKYDESRTSGTNTPTSDGPSGETDGTDESTDRENWSADIHPLTLKL